MHITARIEAVNKSREADGAFGGFVMECNKFYRQLDTGQLTQEQYKERVTRARADLIDWILTTTP